MESAFDIQNKTVLITGANRGIGKVIAEAFLKQGAKKIYAAVRTLSSADPLTEKYGSRVEPILIDLEKPETISAAAKRSPDVEVVVNNAGTLGICSPLDKNAVQTLGDEIKINVHGLISMAQEFAPILKSNGGGVLIQLNSIASLKSFPSFSTYCASKAAAYSITQALREELKEQGTRVISVHPGPIATDMASKAGFAEISEPAQVVADGILDALKSGEFHVFPDTMARNMGMQYLAFAKSVIEEPLM